MKCFVDTSGVLALLNPNDSNHSLSAECWKQLLADGTGLVTSNYVLVELFALVQRRMGMEAVRFLLADLLPVLVVQYVDSSLHEAATGAWLIQSGKRLSLVDCASFEIMRRRSISAFFGFDRDFQEQGFQFIGS